MLGSNWGQILKKICSMPEVEVLYKDVIAYISYLERHCKASAPFRVLSGQQTSAPHHSRMPYRHVTDCAVSDQAIHGGLHRCFLRFEKYITFYTPRENRNSRRERGLCICGYRLFRIGLASSVYSVLQTNATAS